MNARDALEQVHKVLGSLSREEMEATDSDPDVREKQRYLARVDTFTYSTWFAKPNEICPVACARRGWKNVSANMLECEGCKSKLDCTLNPELPEEVVEELTAKFESSLIDSHFPGCAWTEKVCPERFLGGPVGVKAKSSLRQRCFALLDVSEHFPQIVSDTKTIERLDRIAMGLVGKAPAGKDASLGAAYTLALCGWEPMRSELEGSSMLQCAYCRAHMAIGENDTMRWPPKKEVDPVDMLIAVDKGNESESGGAADETGATLSPGTPTAGRSLLKRKLTPKQEAAASIGAGRRFGVPLKRSRSSTEAMQAAKRARTTAGQIDPTNSHRSFCPYLNEGFKVLAVEAGSKSPAGVRGGSVLTPEVTVGDACSAALKALASI